MTDLMESLRPSLSSWQSQVLRLTAFVAPDVQLKAKAGELSWWSEVTGVQSESRTIQSRSSTIIEEGPFRRGALTLKIEPFRIDWLEGQTTEAAIQDDTIPVFGRYEETMPEFISLMEKWFSLTTLPAINRLALGSVLLLPVEMKEAGYKILGSLLLNAKILSGSSDFFYQINHPRPATTKIPGLVINRLSKWSVSHTFTRTFEAGAGEVKVANIQDLYACRLELDINTSPKLSGPIPTDRLNELLKEFMTLSNEIAEKGEAP